LGPVADMRAPSLEDEVWLGGPRPTLKGSRCADCEALFFPARTVCTACGGEQLVPAPLGSSGRVYAWTTVHVSSAGPTPYTIGYVDLDCGVRVLARLTGALSRLVLDGPVTLNVSESDWSFAAEGGPDDAG
jgi:uncharacterized OB-fold protein